MVIRCDECGHGFINYETWHDETEIHPDTGTTPLVMECPECGEEQKRVYHEMDPRNET